MSNDMRIFNIRPGAPITCRPLPYKRPLPYEVNEFAQPKIHASSWRETMKQLSGALLLQYIPAWGSILIFSLATHRLLFSIFILWFIFALSIHVEGQMIMRQTTSPAWVRDPGSLQMNSITIIWSSISICKLVPGHCHESCINLAQRHLLDV